MYVFTLKDPGTELSKKGSADPKPNPKPNHNPYLFLLFTIMRKCMSNEHECSSGMRAQPKLLVPGTRGGTGQLSVHDHVTPTTSMNAIAIIIIIAIYSSYNVAPAIV